MSERLSDDVALLRSLEGLRIAANQLLGGRLLGLRRSRQYGSGNEFADFRSYVPGDDARRLHWQAYLLHRRLLCKLFEEVSEISIYLLVDTSASMAAGTPSKLRYAKQLAVALGYIALSTSDPLRVFPFADGPSGRWDPSPLLGRCDLARLIERLDGFTPRGRTSLIEAARRLCATAPQPGLCVVLSDLFDPAGYAPALRLLAHKRFIVTTIRINEREEIEPLLRGELDLVDSETGDALDVEVTGASLASYRAALERHYVEMAELSAGYGFQHAAALTDRPVSEFIVSLFRRGILAR
jgi:uncharacterized protein (DUF58 family)